MRFVNNSGGQVKFAVEKKERPQTIEFQWLVLTAQERLDKRPRVDVVSVDVAVAVVADEQDFIIKLTKMLMIRHPHQAPGRVQIASSDQALDEVAFLIKDVHETVTRAGYVVMFFVVLESERDVNMAADTGEVERRPSGSGGRSLRHRRRIRIFEVTCDRSRIK